MAGITEYIEPLLKGESLSFEQAESLLDIVLEGQVSEVQIAAFLTAMRIKGATAAELAGLARSLRDHAVKVKVDIDNLIDTCGTGGGVIKTCNISTASAIVAAGAGVYVAKHGNRGITSKCGSADVLEALGVKIDAGAETTAECIKQAHIGFMFAPAFHPAMKYVQPIRKGLGFRTVFNILGPLANPAGVQRQVLGVADENLMETIAEALKLLGTKVAMVVHSSGMDEISTAGVTKIVEVKSGKIESCELNAEDLGIAPADINDLKVTDSKTSAEVLRNILKGKEGGPRKDIVILNAAAAIIVSGLAEDFGTAIKMADTSVRDGKALDCLEKLIEVSNSR
ncbi:MAG: anthranilate phosphoribosyltransferase [Sedimentisphaerales bacterium]|nr:anthranilate phosphoribosyltransferase [Sedimentisphaerales bacterium]